MIFDTRRVEISELTAYERYNFASQEAKVCIQEAFKEIEEKNGKVMECNISYIISQGLENALPEKDRRFINSLRKVDKHNYGCKWDKLELIESIFCPVNLDAALYIFSYGFIQGQKCQKAAMKKAPL